MKAWLQVITLGTSLLFGTAVFAEAPADAPAGSTALCKDGTYFSGAKKKGACRGHKGIKEWYGPEEKTAAGPKKKSDKTSEKASASAAAAKHSAPAAAAEAPAPADRKASAPIAAASGGGAGKVWVNTESKVYHCQGDEWYGKTKAGEYMSEADAEAKGFRASRGKTCQ